LLDTGYTQIIANCDFLNNEVISNLHFINKKKQSCVPIDPNVHKWVKDLTYIISIEIIINNKNKIIIDTINGTILFDDSNILYETITNNKYGLYSITHYGYYPQIEFKKYVFNFNEGYITLSIDKFWDDINYIQLFLNNDKNNYTGELIKHDDNNVIQKFV